MSRVFLQLPGTALVFGALAVLHVWPAARASAFDAERTLLQYSHRAWQAKEGLPHNAVHAIAQTPDGYLWLGTQAGLVRFDGDRFTVFTRENTDWIKENVIEALAVSRDGALWVGTSGAGVCRLRDNRAKCYRQGEGLANEYVRAIFEGRDGTVWVGTGAGGLFRFKGERFTHVGRQYNVINGITEDGRGDVWAATKNGLYRVSGESLKIFTTADGLPTDWLLSILLDGAGRLWVGHQAGMSCYDKGRFTHYSSRDGLPAGGVTALFEDRERNLWVGAAAGGLGRFHRGRFVFFNNKDGLTDDFVLTLHEDREGGLWVGTKGGLDRFYAGAFTSHTSADGLPTDAVATLIAARDQSLWLNTSGSGMIRMKDGKVTSYTTRDGLPTNYLRAIVEGPDGGVWATTENMPSAPLVRIKDGRVMVFTAKDGLPTSMTLIFQHEGQLIVSSANGVFRRFEGGRFVPWLDATGLNIKYANSAFHGRDGVTWLGLKGGLGKLRGRELSLFTTADGLPHQEVFSAYEDAEGNVWVATRGGLSLLRNGKFTNYQIGDVLFNITEDHQGELWIGSNKGVIRAGRKELLDYADGRAGKVTPVVYGAQDGMRSAELIWTHSSGVRTGDGRIWFATYKGLAVVDPRKIRVNPAAPPVYVERFVVSDEDMPLTGGVELPPGGERLDFHYTGLSFLAPDRMRFRYKLEGFDDDWVDAGARRTAYFTKVPPGRYTFRVSAANQGGAWSEPGASFTFSIRPHFYQAWWFYLLCAALAGVGIWSLHLLHVRQVKARFALILEERGRIAREIHDTLEQGLAGIVMQLDLAAAKLSAAPETIREYLELARTMATYSKSEARRTIWNLRPAALEGGDLASALSEIARQLTSGVALETEINLAGAPRPLPAELENNLLRIGQEAITNAVKHARARRIRIDLAYERRAVSLSVRDDGCGFDAEPACARSQGHFGLLGMRERAHQFGGRLLIKSLIGEGTQVQVSFPSSNGSKGGHRE